MVMVMVMVMVSLITGSDTHTHTHTKHLVGFFWTGGQRRLPDNTRQWQETGCHAPGGFGNSIPRMCAAADRRLRPYDHRYRRWSVLLPQICVRELWTAKTPCQVCCVRAENKKHAPPRMRAGFLITESLRFVFVFMDC